MFTVPTGTFRSFIYAVGSLTLRLNISSDWRYHAHRIGDQKQRIVNWEFANQREGPRDGSR